MMRKVKEQGKHQRTKRKAGKVLNIRKSPRVWAEGQDPGDTIERSLKVSVDGYKGFDGNSVDGEEEEQ